MSSIDGRVVQMRFDNQQFESGAKTSLATLSKLKSALTFGKAAKEMADFQKQANGFSLGGVGSAIETVGIKFSAFEAIGLRVLTNIADSAYRTGTKLVKSLSVDNIAAGWKKFEDKTTSVATLVAQGYDMQTVDEQLSRLNWFTDETSYNFVDMVSSIGKFTASGKGLEESVNAMEGIATWASLSGQNASTASRAMYQLSQAMGAGVMRKEDYKSIQNMSMDTDEFRQKALDAGVALGTLKKNADGTYQSIVEGVGKVDSFSKSQFAEHLTKDLWFTDKVMMKVFGDYGAAVDQIYEYAEENGVTASEAIAALGDKVDAFGLKAFKSAQEAKTFTDVLDSVKDAVSTGWMTTFEYIFGNYEESKVLWTDLANELYGVFAESGNLRNQILDDWKEMGGRDAMLEGFWDAWNGIANVLGIVKEAWREVVFDITDVELPTKLWEISESVAKFAKSFKELFELPANLEKLDKDGLFDESQQAKIEATRKRIENFSKTFHGIFAIIDIIKQGLGAIAQLGVRLLKSILPVGDTLLGFTGSFGDWAMKLRDSIEETNFFGNVVEKLGPIVDKTGSVIIWVLDKIRFLFVKAKGIFKPFTKESTDAANTVTEKWSPITGLVDLLKKAFGRIGEIFTAIQPILQKLGEGLGAAWDTLHEKIMTGLQGLNVKSGQDIVNGGLFGILLLALNNFINKVKGAVPQGDVIKSLMQTVTDSIGAVANAIQGLAPKVEDNKPPLLELAGAIGILALSLLIISTIDTDKLIRSVGAIGVLLYALEDVMERLSKITASSSFASEEGGIFRKLFGTITGRSESTNIEAIAKSMLMVAASVAILAGSVYALSKLDWEALAKGLVGVGALLGMIVLVAAALSSMEGRLVKGAGALIFVGIAVGILTNSVKKLSELDPDKLVNGLMAVGALLLELGVFSKFAGKINLRTGLAIIAIASSLLIVSQAVKAFGSMDASEGGELATGLSAIAAVLMGFVVFSQTVKSKGILKAATALMIMAASLHVINAAVKSMGKLDEDQITRGVGGLAGALLTLMLVATVLASVKGTGGAALSILVMSAALIALSVAFKIMASIPYTSIMKVLLGFAAAFVVIGVAGALLGPLTLGILGLSLALVGISAAILLAGMGLTALSAGIMALGASLLVAGPMLVNGIMTTLLAVLYACYRLIPTFVNVGLSIILNLLIGIYEKLPEIATMATLVILKFLLTISQLFPLIIMVGIQMIVNFINGMALAIRDNSESIMMAVGNLMSSIVYMVLTGVQMIAEQIPIIGGWVSDGIEGIKNSIDESFSEEEMAKITERGMSGATKGMAAAEADAKTAGSGLGDASVDGFLEKLPLFQNATKDMGVEGLDGLLNLEGDYENAGYTLGVDAISGADSPELLEQMFGNGINYGTGFNNGMLDKEDEAEAAGYAIGKAAVRGNRKALEEQSPSKVMFKVGNFATQGLINGLLSLKGETEDAAYSVGESSADALSSAMRNLSTILNSEMDVNPTITPVLDLSKIQNGTNTLNGMLGGTRSFALAASNGIQFEANRLEALNKLETQSTNADVVAALGLLRGDVNNLNDSFANTQVVLDSGALVGATAKQMDNALGRIKVYKGRGI